MPRESPVAHEDRLGPNSLFAAFHRAPGREKQRHTSVAHGHATLAFYTGGSSRVEQSGDWQLTAGDVLVVPAGQPHRVWQSQRPEYWQISFAAACFAADDAALLDPFERVRDGASAVIQIPPARQGFLEHLLRETAAPGQAPRPSPAAVQKSLLTLIMSEVERASRGAGHQGQRGGGVVAESLRFIERNCLRRLTLAEVAASVRRSPAHVTSALARATGRSVNEWIVLGRMAEARRRLLHSDEMVDVIAERVGYADVTHFIRMFRRHHGATPSAWRAAQRA